MFSTFSATANPSNFSHENARSAETPRPKRVQVARACDWCRLNRVRCDDDQPCRNCRNRDAHCSNTKKAEVKSLPAANREIQRLRNQIKDLQRQVGKVNGETQSQGRNHDSGHLEAATPPLSNSSSNSSTRYSALSNTKRGREGIQEPGNEAGGIYYGPMSSTYFVSRISRYLSQALNEPFDESRLQACVSRINSSAANRRPPRPGGRALSQNRAVDSTEVVKDLTRPQEEAFLNLLWQSFHCVYPIIHEPEFREYYDALWSDPGSGTPATRKPSALVDALLAVSVQYGSSFLLDDESRSPAAPGEANQAGHAFYRRSQKLLSEELEHPSIRTLQSHIYCIIYLYHSSLLNTAHISLGVAVRIGQALRLHLCPLESTPRPKQDLHRRIWWTLYRLDSQLSMTLGRPPLIHTSDVSCGLPGDDRDGGLLSELTLLSHHYDDISWLSFHNQCVKLTFLIRGVQTAFRHKCSNLLDRDGQDGQTGRGAGEDIYDDPRTTETLATFLSRELGVISDWVENVPSSLRAARKGSGEPFSVYQTTLDLEPRVDPLWLQRQRLLLELLYHHLLISTLRPFLRFPPVATSLTPSADGHSIGCVNHAMAMTSILNQVLSNTTLLNGWSLVFQYQWDAVLCTLGFVLANPVCPPTPSARKSLQTAISTLELLGGHFAAATNAAEVAQDVGCRAGNLIERFRETLISA